MPAIDSSINRMVLLLRYGDYIWNLWTGSRRSRNKNITVHYISMELHNDHIYSDYLFPPNIFMV